MNLKKNYFRQNRDGLSQDEERIKKIEQSYRIEQTQYATFNR